jgi:hypothetical protein
MQQVYCIVDVVFLGACVGYRWLLGLKSLLVHPTVVLYDSHSSAACL